MLKFKYNAWYSILFWGNLQTGQGIVIKLCLNVDFM